MIGSAAGFARLVLVRMEVVILAYFLFVNGFYAVLVFAAIPELVSGLRTMIGAARGRTVQVFLGTLLPERVGACRGYAPDVVAPANDQIRALAASENVVLVDLYAAFGADAPTTLIGFDGLHPTAAGYELIAQKFFESIRQKLEVGSVPLKLKTR